LTTGALELVRQLRGQGVRLGLVTSAEQAAARALLSKHGLASSFEHIVCAEDFKRGKPAPDPYLRALELFGVPAARALVVEDSGNGVKSALAAGIRTLRLCPERKGQADTIATFAEIWSLVFEAAAGYRVFPVSAKARVVLAPGEAAAPDAATLKKIA